MKTKSLEAVRNAASYEEWADEMRFLLPSLLDGEQIYLFELLYYQAEKSHCDERPAGEALYEIAEDLGLRLEKRFPAPPV